MIYGANRVARVPFVLSPIPSETFTGFTQLLSIKWFGFQAASAKKLVNAGGGYDKCGNRNRLRVLQHRGSPALPDTLFRGRRPLAASQGDVQDAEEGDLEGADAAAAEETGKPEVSLFCDGANPRVSRLPQNLLDVGGAAEQPGMESDFEKIIDLVKYRVAHASCRFRLLVC